MPADKNTGSVPMADASASTDAERGRAPSARYSRRRSKRVEEQSPKDCCLRASTRKSSSAFCSELNAAHSREWLVSPHP